MGWKSLAVLACAIAAMAIGATIHATPQQAQTQVAAQAVQDPEECAKLKGLDAQMACLNLAMKALQAPAGDPIEPPDGPPIEGDPASGACYLVGKSQPVWPNGQPMGGTVTADQCIANHGASVADFAQFCEAGLQVGQQAGPNNLVLRYLDACPANPKSMCSMKNLPRHGADPDDPASYTARVDFYFYPANDQQADEAGCDDKRFF